MRYILGILAVALGCILVIKTEWFVQNFGSNAWAEEHLGTSGGTRLMYKLVGIAMIFFAMMAITGLLGGFIMGTFGRLFPTP